MMKKLILIFGICALFIGCASKPAANTERVAVQDNTEELAQAEELPKFDDWKYRGFGTEFPEWFEPALENDADLVRKILSVPEGTKIRIAVEDGIDVDQCEQKLNENSPGSNYEVFQSCWARLNPQLYSQDDMYVSVRLYTEKTDS